MGKILNNKDLTGRKIISHKIGETAKTSHGDKVNIYASSHKNVSVPKGTKKWNGPAD